MFKTKIGLGKEYEALSDYNITVDNKGMSVIQEQKYDSNYTKYQHSNKNNVGRPVELEVNISIGKNRFLLQVYRCSHLHEEVQQFLKLHHINLKYEGPILAMVREQLSKKEIFKDATCNEIQQLKRIKSQIDNKRRITVEQQTNNRSQDHQSGNEVRQEKVNHHTRQNKQNYSSEYNSNSKHGISTGQSQAQSHIRQVAKQTFKTSTDEDTKCQSVYEKWKAKEKIKENERAKNANPTQKSKNKAHSKSIMINQKEQDKGKDKDKSTSQKKLQAHSPDYFYKKGIKFRQAKQVHVQEMYKEKYPFQLKKQATLTPTKKNQLHERLFKDYQVKEKNKLQKQIGNIKMEKEEEKKPVMDKYKQKVIERDNKIDKALGYLISNKLIENPYKIENVAKSPFRKTNL